jgi:Lrp/AsnC family transcriptional regulator of ectoine degradation
MSKRVKLDRLDLKILDALIHDGCISKVALGDKVGLSPTPCFERIKKMEHAKIIRGYHADVDLSKLADIMLVLVMTVIVDCTPEKAARFNKYISSMPEVIGASAVMGNYDNVLVVAARNIEHYQRILQRILDIKLMVIDYQSFPVTNTFSTQSILSLIPLIEAIEQDRKL